MTEEERIIWLSAFGAYASTLREDNHVKTRYELAVDRANYAVHLYNEALSKLATPTGLRKR